MLTVKSNLNELLSDCGTIDAVSWQPPANMSYELWEKVGQRFQQVSGSINWWLGDWISEGDKRYGEMYTQAVELTGSKLETLQTCKWVSSAVKSSIRIELLSWTHHRYIAHLPESEQTLWLNHALDNGLSSKELKRALELANAHRKPLPKPELDWVDDAPQDPPLPEQYSTFVAPTADNDDDPPFTNPHSVLYTQGDDYSQEADSYAGDASNYNWTGDVSIERHQSDLKPFFRYPGGKGKMSGTLVNQILSLADGISEYREPFVGGGGVFLPVLSTGRFDRYWINDFDFGIYSVWLSVKSFAYELISQVDAFTPSVDAFYEFRETLNGDGRNLHPAQIAFMKIAIHQMSYSGLGTKAGGPIGGAGQKSKYDVGCRWNSDRITKGISDINQAMRHVDMVITCLDYESMLEHCNAVVYLDPPYYHKGAELYQQSFTEADHNRLSAKLQDAAFPWVLSYDHCDDVQNMYDWADMKTTDEIHYSISLKGKQSRFSPEYVITGGAG